MNNLNISSNHANEVHNALVGLDSVKIVNVRCYNIGSILGAIPSIGISVYYNTKEECASGIIDNGKHFKAMIHGNGQIAYLMGHKMSAKLRQGKVKSLQDAINKIVKYAKEA